MFISSIFIHALFFWGAFLYAPHFAAKNLKIQDYQVSLISPKLLNIEHKQPAGPVSLPESAPTPPPAPVVKNAEVGMEIAKKAVPIKAPPPLPPAKFFPDPVIPKIDSAVTIPPPMEVQSVSKSNGGKPIPPESSASELSPEKNGISATAGIEGAGNGQGAAPNGSGFGYPYYLSNIEHKIAQQWAPPRATISAKRERAIAVIGFLIKQDGRIDTQSIVVEKSSGNAFFDMAALRAINNANPMPPLPKGISDNLKVHFTFAVSLDS
jgi:protein TonB